MKNDLVWIVAGRILIGLISLMALRVSTYLLLPTQYGVFVIMLTFNALIVLFMINPTLNFIKREANYWIKEKLLLNKLYQFKKLVYIAGILGSSLVLVWSIYKGLTIEIILLQTILSFFMLISSVSLAISTTLLQLVGLRKASVIWMLTAVSSALIASWLLTTIYASGLSWLLGQIIGLSIGAIGSSLKLKKYFPEKSVKGYRLLDKKTIKNFIIPLTITYLVLWWTMLGYRLVFESYWGIAAVGYFVVSYGLANQIWTLIDSITSQYLLPLYFKGISSKKVSINVLSDLINTVIPVYLLITSAMLISVGALLKILVSPTYSYLTTFLFFGFMVESCRVMTELFSLSAFIKGKMQEIIIPYLVGAISLGIGIIYVIINKGDIEDTLIFLLISGILALLTMIIRMKRKYNFSIDYIRWSIGLILVAFSIWFSINYPIAINSYLTALTLLLIVGTIAFGILILLLWNNKSTKGLLKIELLITKK